MANGNGNSTNQVLPWVFAGVGMIGAIVVFVWGQINPKEDIGLVETRVTNRVMDVETRLTNRIVDVEKRLNEQLREAQAAQVKTSDEIKAKLATFLPLMVHTEFAGRKDKDTDRLQTEIDSITKILVPREEHKQNWDTMQDRLNGIREQVTEIRQNISSSASIGKQFDTINQMLLELQRRIDARPVMPPIVGPNTTIRPSQ